MKRNYPYIDIAIFCTLGVMVLISCLISYITFIQNENFRYFVNEEDIPESLDLSTY